MPERMASQCIAAEEDHVDDQDDRPEANPEILVARVSIEEPHRLVGVAGKDDEKDKRSVEEVLVLVLNHEREDPFAAITLPGLAHGAVRRVCPEALVIRPPIVVAREPEARGKGQDQEGRRKWNERGEPRWPASVDPRVRRVGEKPRRVIWTPSDAIDHVPRAKARGQSG